jgi:hypothetical protein
MHKSLLWIIDDPNKIKLPVTDKIGGKYSRLIPVKDIKLSKLGYRIGWQKYHSAEYRADITRKSNVDFAKIEQDAQDNIDVIVSHYHKFIDYLYRPWTTGDGMWEYIQYIPEFLKNELHIEDRFDNDDIAERIIDSKDYLRFYTDFISIDNKLYFGNDLSWRKNFVREFMEKQRDDIFFVMVDVWEKQGEKE